MPSSSPCALSCGAVGRIRGAIDAVRYHVDGSRCCREPMGKLVRDAAGHGHEAACALRPVAPALGRPAHASRPAGVPPVQATGPARTKDVRLRPAAVVAVVDRRHVCTVQDHRTGGVQDPAPPNPGDERPDGEEPGVGEHEGPSGRGHSSPPQPGMWRQVASARHDGHREPLSEQAQDQRGEHLLHAAHRPDAVRNHRDLGVARGHEPLPFRGCFEGPLGISTRMPIVQ